MSYQEFLAAFAVAQGVGDVDTLLGEHAARYKFQITSRERAQNAIALLADELGVDWRGLRVLDVGCAYGAFTIELTKLGARAVGIDNNAKWLGLAAVNARGEVDAPFIDCDASAFAAREALAPHGPFDLVLLNDVLEHVYDTAGLLANLEALTTREAAVWFEVPNGLATQHVLAEGHKKIFGLSLLAPDHWPAFVATPFHIFYRRWPYFPALFGAFGFGDLRLITRNRDRDIERTRARIREDLDRIGALIAAGGQSPVVERACGYYLAEAEHDLATMAGGALYLKYRARFWKGIARKSGSTR
ncbi:MAG: class I SAM-dependent methyltransferase [Sphingomonadaceae bacterium]|nr:class I SAM-dependent methyltransferase [Sphingomonadaceae bacterium]